MSPALEVSYMAQGREGPSHVEARRPQGESRMLQEGKEGREKSKTAEQKHECNLRSRKKTVF